ncbi:hypothetical protein [Nocardioides sp. L-11A]|uniref:hypothetical protein n=1 Tax=Nocardioides sp. L-11A TaxID=3043848 RepID=UPI00249C4BCB|nr:hypothetical protein QJ852_09945 [Nocardioides sp. L-11A]
MMVQVLGNATTGNVYNDSPAQLDLPRDTSTTRAAHQPWCVDCKRKGRDLDDNQRCPQCARAAITRAAGEARRAAEEQARAEAEAAAKAAAKKTPAPQPASATPHQPPKEGKQGKPTTRSSAPRATSTSDVPDRGRTPGRAPGAGSSTHREKNPPAARETRPVAAGGPSGQVGNRATPTAAQILDAQLDHARDLLRTTAAHPHPAVAAARTAVVAALEALHLLVELTPATPATKRPARAGRDVVPGAGGRRIDLPATDVITAYQAGQTMQQIGEHYGVSHMTVRRCLIDHNIPRRKTPVEHAPELVEQVRRLYEDEQLTQVEIAEKIGRSTKAVQNIMTAAGIDRRPAKARRGRDNAIALKDRITELGTNAAEIRRWAIAVGHLQPGAHRGLPPRSLVEKYAAAHPTPRTA